MLVLSHSEFEFVICLFFWISESMRKIIKKFENYSQPAKLVGKPDQLVH